MTSINLTDVIRKLESLAENRSSFDDKKYGGDTFRLRMRMSSRAARAAIKDLEMILEAEDASELIL